MIRKVRPAFEVKADRKGSFLAWFETLDKNSGDYKLVVDVLSILKANVSSGTQIPKDRWPRVYVKKYDINNLYKIDILGGRRLTYTILGDERGYFVIILDYFSLHKEYEKFFKY